MDAAQKQADVNAAGGSGIQDQRKKLPPQLLRRLLVFLFIIF